MSRKIGNHVLIAHPQDSEKPSVLNVGSEQLLKTFMDGVVEGMKIGGYKRLIGQGFRVAHMTHNLRPTVRIILLTQEEWKAY